MCVPVFCTELLRRRKEQSYDDSLSVSVMGLQIWMAAFLKVSEKWSFRSVIFINIWNLTL